MDTTFLVVPPENCQEQRNIWKGIGTEWSKRKFVFHFFKVIFDNSLRLSPPFFGLIFANEKHDSGMKFTCPEFCVPFAQTVNCPVCPCKQWTTIMSHSFQKAAFLSYQGNWYKTGTSYKTNKNWWTGTGLKTYALIWPYYYLLFDWFIY